MIKFYRRLPSYELIEIDKEEIEFYCRENKMPKQSTGFLRFSFGGDIYVRCKDGTIIKEIDFETKSNQEFYMSFEKFFELHQQYIADLVFNIDIFNSKDQK